MSYYQLPSPLIYEISGKDSARYLHARLSNDIKALSNGASCLAAALSPQGRIEGLFTVLRQDASRFILVADGGNPESVHTALFRYRVADRVDCKDLSATHVLIHLLDGSQIDTAISEQGSIFFKRRRTRTYGTDFIVPKADCAALLKTLPGELLSPEQFTIERILGNAPQFPDDVGSDNILLEAPTLQAASFTKGCYVGQEVLEKVDSHGKLPRILVPGKTKAEVAPGAVLSLASAPEEKFGKVITAARDTHSKVTYFFALVRNNSAKVDCVVNGAPVELV